MPHTNEPQAQHMTAEDKMRKAALTIYGDTPVSQVEKDAFKNGWQSCAAQSAETIARLEEENTELQAKVDALDLTGLRKAVEFIDTCKASDNAASTGAFKDAREWVESEVRALLSSPNTQGVE